MPRLFKRSSAPFSRLDAAAQASFAVLFMAVPLVYHPSPTHVGILVGIGFAYFADSVTHFLWKRNRSRA